HLAGVSTAAKFALGQVARKRNLDVERKLCGLGDGFEHRFRMLGRNLQEDFGWAGRLAAALLPVLEGIEADAECLRKLSLAETQAGADSGDGVGRDAVDLGHGLAVAADVGARVADALE